MLHPVAGVATVCVMDVAAAPPYRRDAEGLSNIHAVSFGTNDWLSVRSSPVAPTLPKTVLCISLPYPSYAYSVLLMSLPAPSDDHVSSDRFSTRCRLVMRSA